MEVGINELEGGGKGMVFPLIINFLILKNGNDEKSLRKTAVQNASF